MQNSDFEQFMINLVKNECDEHRIDNDLDIGECDYRSFFVINKDSLLEENADTLNLKFDRADFLPKEDIADALDMETMKTMIEQHPESARLKGLLNDPKIEDRLSILNTGEYIALRYTDPEGTEYLGFELYINGADENKIMSWAMTEDNDGDGYYCSDSNEALSDMLGWIDDLEIKKQNKIEFLKEEALEEAKANASKPKHKPKM